ncbi:MAG: PDZ domain-containing protein [Chlamydiales bacterium]|nr:PDZ domain-containing protein [Chlamydiales bacterium]
MRLLPFFFLLLIGPVFGKPPELDVERTKSKVNEILNSHVSHKKLDIGLAERILANFLDIIDPLKMYFIESEIEKWQNPASSYLMEVLDNYQKGDFQAFEDVLELMVKATARRSETEDSILNTKNFYQDVDIEEFTDMTWAKNEEELKSRISRIRSLQVETASKLGEETKDILLERLKKRRLSYEEEILGKDAIQRKKQMYALFIKAVCSSLDTHTNYFTPREASQFVIQVQQRLFGIGALLRDDLNGLTITELLDGGPAKLSGFIREGDKIIAVNHEPIIGLDILDAVSLIRGPKDSKVVLTISRESKNKEEEVVEIEIARGEVVLKESRYEKLIEPFADGVILTIHLHAFYQDPTSSSSTDIKREIEETKREHKLLGMVLDLRNNGGGLLPQAVSVSGLFIKNGIVASIKDDGGTLHHLRTLENQVTYDGPLIVLINKASASASEIVAQSLQDYGRALVVGDKHSFGKGTFQIFTLENQNSHQVNPEGEYKVTKGIYYTVSGKTPQLIGTEADIEVPGYLFDSKIGERFEKNPLPNETIPHHFDDDLSDIHPLHRLSLRKTYCKNLQKKSDELKKVVPILGANSKNRITQNKNYQQFLNDIKEKKKETSDFGMNDLQYEETINIMKDFILLSHYQTHQ